MCAHKNEDEDNGGLQKCYWRIYFDCYCVWRVDKFHEGYEFFAVKGHIRSVGEINRLSHHQASQQ